MIAMGGFRCRLLERDRDGGALYGVAEAGLLRREEVWLRFAPWRRRAIPVKPVRDLYERVLKDGMVRGVFLAPGAFAEEAQAFASGRALELIDGERFLETLRRLDLRERDRLRGEATQEEFTEPTCPTCGKAMFLRDGEAPSYSGKGEKRRYRGLARVRRQIRCDQLMVETEARIVFDSPAHCLGMEVRGHAHGDFVCQGTVEIFPEGKLSGSVAARAIRIYPGGTVEGAMKVERDAARVSAVRPEILRPVWGCSGYPKCAQVLDVRGEGE
jgi:hypothetical protein